MIVTSVKVGRPTSTAVRTIIAVTASVGLFGFPAVLRAQHRNFYVKIGVDDDRLTTDKRIYGSSFPVTGGSQEFTSLPGFADDASWPHLANVEFVYNVLEDLYFWDGTDFLKPEPETLIRIQNNRPGLNETRIDGMSGEQMGSFHPSRNRIGATNTRGDLQNHLNFFLSAGTSPIAPGAYGIMLSLNTNMDRFAESEPLFVVFNYDLEKAEFDQGLLAYEDMLLGSPPLGDFNGNRILDVDDIDMLSIALRDGSTDGKFDVNQDGVVDGQDRVYWVEALAETSPGDSNLDGEFTSTDLVSAFQSGEYEDIIPGNSYWAEGDWDGDFEFTSKDVILAFQTGLYEAEQSVAATPILAVPEPSTAALLFLGLLLMLFRYHSTGKSRCVV